MSSEIWARRLAIAAVVLGVLGIGASIVGRLMGTKARDRVEAPPAPPPAPQPSGVVPAPPSPLPIAVAAAPSAEPTASAEKESLPPPPRSYRFDARAARAALDALAPTLTDCRIPKGRSGKVEITFEPDGHISSSKPLDMYVGTFGGKCVARHLKQATIPPFYGETKTYTYAFVIPE